MKQIDVVYDELTNFFSWKDFHCPFPLPFYDEQKTESVFDTTIDLSLAGFSTDEIPRIMNGRFTDDTANRFIGYVMEQLSKSSKEKATVEVFNYGSTLSGENLKKVFLQALEQTKPDMYKTKSPSNEMKDYIRSAMPEHENDERDL